MCEGAGGADYINASFINVSFCIYKAQPFDVV